MGFKQLIFFSFFCCSTLSLCGFQDDYNPFDEQLYAFEDVDPSEENENTQEELFEFEDLEENSVSQNEEESRDAALPQEQKQLIEISNPQDEPSPISINFNDVEITELIRFVSRISGKNFFFDEAELNFRVTIVSEDPTSIENVLTALIQILRVRGFQVNEQGNNLMVYPASDVRNISRVGVEGEEEETNGRTELVTQVFRLNTLDPAQAAAIIVPLSSPQAQIEPSTQTRHLIVTDLVTNVEKIAKLIRSIDAPNGGLVVGQYRVQSNGTDELVELATQILEPIVIDQPFQFVSHSGSNSIFIVSSPYLVEKAISILEEVDRLEGETKILDLDRLRPTLDRDRERGGPPSDGNWELGPDGKRRFRTRAEVDNGRSRPDGDWILDPNGNWYFVPRGKDAPFGLRREGPQVRPGEQPKGAWELAPDGSWVFQLAPGEQVTPDRIRRESQFLEDQPVGAIDRTKFFLQKLKYRSGDEIQDALLRISESLRLTEGTNLDLLDAISTVQWIETSNSLIITGTGQAVRRVMELVEEIDVPLRQVFVEVLILDTSITDSLNFGVSWGSRSGGSNTATSQAFIGGANALPQFLDTGGIGNTPDGAIVARQLGYTLGIIGQTITHNGTQFSELAALVKAIHEKTNARIVLNPKLIAEDGVTAEIFVGINTRFRTQSIANDEGSILTTNFEFRDVGTTLRVTPFLNSDDIVTLEVEQESSSVATGQSAAEALVDAAAGPTTRVNRTRTRFHVPDGHFLVMSGMIDDEETRSRVQVPCLGGLPLLGWAFSEKRTDDQKRNLMLFVRPQIINSVEEIRELTRHQQNVYKVKNETEPNWRVEVDEAFDWANIDRDCCKDTCCD